MHAEEFLNEVLASSICPDNFQAIYHEFQGYQQLALNTLNEFHRVCEKNKIPYQLAFGSLLGAVRDDGQIPWDYDVDVWVARNKVPDLINALKKDLSKKYYFYCPDTDTHCRHYMMRIAPVGYRSEVLHVDVFYMIGAPENNQERSEFAKQIYDIFYTRYYKLVKIKENSHGRIKHAIKLILKKFQYSTISINALNEQYNQICNKFPFDESKYCISFGGETVSFLRESLWDTKIIHNSCGEFRITKNYDETLHILYGNYKEIFPLENRINELMNHYKLLKNESEIKN